ncbi:MAG: degQ [Rhodocyclaceae bacterium]|nr:degQ [Rhodocyclaceae bacterium]
MSRNTAARRLALSLLAACILGACQGSSQESAGNAPASPTPPAGAPPAASRAAALPDFSGLVDNVGPAVVNVVSSRREAAGSPGVSGPAPDDPLFEFFRRFIPDLPRPGSPEQQILGLGSGFIISPDGLVLTNAHVVADARSVTVRLADGKREFPGKVLGVDLPSDVALVKIEATGLPVARLGNSHSIKPGQWVVAIGSPFGFTNTITAGIVSAINRELPDESILPFIQTDVAVNPGNSGGPLIDMSGSVVGINSMIYSGTGGYMGLSFAIPIEVAMDVAKQLQAKGKVTRGRIGVVIQPVTEELAQAFRLKSTTGVVISAVEPGSPADRAGLKSGDVVLEYNGKPLADPMDLPRQVASTQPGSPARLAIWRDGARKELTVKVGETPAEKVTESPKTPSPAPANQFGMVLSEVPPALRKRLGIDYGLLVEALKGAAADSPLRPGDVIIAVNQTRFTSLAEFNRILNKLGKNDAVAFLVRRGTATLYVTVKLSGDGE